MVECEDMLITKYKDFNILVAKRGICIDNGKDVYWAEIKIQLKEESMEFFLEKTGKIIQFEDLENEDVEYRSLEDLEDALSKFYHIDVRIDYPRTHKELV